ncbi:hypothetical protein LY76DRAFT_432415 [Colletotrichum caudatum]|nr:hypothetical protein LY76DRAFT_432415 [Colletotrichum caudatum]
MCWSGDGLHAPPPQEKLDIPNSRGFAIFLGPRLSVVCRVAVLNMIDHDADVRQVMCQSRRRTAVLFFGHRHGHGHGHAQGLGFGLLLFLLLQLGMGRVGRGRRQRHVLDGPEGDGVGEADGAGPTNLTGNGARAACDGRPGALTMGGDADNRDIGHADRVSFS